MKSEPALEALDRIIGRMVMRGDPAGTEAFEALKVVQRLAIRARELEAAVEAAPHSEMCRFVRQLGMPSDCDCWLSRISRA